MAPGGGQAGRPAPAQAEGGAGGGGGEAGGGEDGGREHHGGAEEEEARERVQHHTAQHQLQPELQGENLTFLEPDEKEKSSGGQTEGGDQQEGGGHQEEPGRHHRQLQVPAAVAAAQARVDLQSAEANVPGVESEQGGLVRLSVGHPVRGDQAEYEGGEGEEAGDAGDVELGEVAAPAPVPACLHTWLGPPHLTETAQPGSPLLSPPPSPPSPDC